MKAWYCRSGADDALCWLDLPQRCWSCAMMTNDMIMLSKERLNRKREENRFELLWFVEPQVKLLYLAYVELCCR